MYQRIQTTRKVDASIRDHVERLAVIGVELRRLSGKSFAAGLYAHRRQIHSPQNFRVAKQVSCPTPEARCDLENGSRGKIAVDAREETTEPLGFGPSPGNRPLFASLRPVVDGIPVAAVLFDLHDFLGY